jgi:hypothetical protein
LAPSGSQLRQPFFTFSLRMQAVQTVRLTTPPFSITLIFCKLGENFRRVIPVVCNPMPPFALANP